MFALNISGPKVDARRAALILADAQLSGDVTQRYSAVGGDVEPSARVEVYGTPTRVDLVCLWTALREAFGLKCAWLDGFGHSGCILDLPAPTLFPLQAATSARVIPVSTA